MPNEDHGSKNLEGRRRQMIQEATVKGYLRQPQTEDELYGADGRARAMIAEEPWERW